MTKVAVVPQETELFNLTLKENIILASENKNKETKNGIITNAIKPDFALIHAQFADKEGNVFIEDPLIENLLVNSSKDCFLSTEE